MRISDWSSDVCSSDLVMRRRFDRIVEIEFGRRAFAGEFAQAAQRHLDVARAEFDLIVEVLVFALVPDLHRLAVAALLLADEIGRDTSELQSLMRISYAVFCLRKTHYFTVNQAQRRHWVDTHSPA